MTVAAVDPERPFLGLQSFQEQDCDRFYGREADLEALFSHLRRETLTVLFGRSGLGKTSLLQAGLFPRLPRDDCFPVAIRLDCRPSAPGFLVQVRDSLARDIRARSVDARPPGDDEDLWEYFHRTPFWNQKNRLVTPVLVFDQFEEFLALEPARKDSAEFRIVLADLVENRIPGTVRRQVEEGGLDLPSSFEIPKIKVIQSLREDFLAELESLRELMPSLVMNRYRLTPLHGADALRAVRNPGGHLVTDDVAEKIVRFVAGAGGDGDPYAGGVAPLEELQVEPSLLSLVCFELNERRIREKGHSISAELLEGSRAEILGRFYERAVGQHRELRSFVEDRLLTRDGHRTSVALAEATGAGVSEAQAEGLVGARLLRKEDRYGAPHLEIIHDLLVEPIRVSRDRRRASASHRKRRQRQVKVAAGLVLLALALAVFQLWRLSDRIPLTTVYQERGRQYLLEGDRRRALAYLAEAYWLSKRPLDIREAPGSLQLLVARALAGLEPQLPALRGHTLEVMSVSFDRTGRRIVTASKDRTARVWDADTGEPGATLEGHDGRVTSAAFDPEGRRIVTASWDGTAKIWDAETGELGATLEGHDGLVTSAAFDPEGRRIVTASWDGTAKIWDAASGEAGPTLKGHTAPVTSAMFGPRGQRVVTASADQTAKVWDATTGEVLHILQGHAGPVTSAAFDADGRWIVTASWDGTAKIWDVATGEVLQTLEGHAGPVNSAAFGPGDRRVVTASSDGTARLWDVQTGELLPPEIHGHGNEVYSAAFDPRGNRVVTASKDETAMLWNAGREPVRSVGDGSEDFSAVALSPDGRRVVTADQGESARIWFAETGESAHTLQGHKGPVRALAFGPRGDYVLTGGDDGTARIWDTNTGRLVHTYQGHEGAVRAVAFGPGGDHVFTGGDDKTARVWDAKVGGLVQVLEGHDKAVRAVTLSPNGERVATGGEDKTVKIWSAKTGGLLRSLQDHEGAVLCIAFSPDGEHMVTGSWDSTAKIWGTKQGKLLRTLTGHTGAVVSVGFSPDGALVVSVSDDATTKVWDGTTGDLLLSLESDVGSRDLRAVDCQADSAVPGAGALPVGGQTLEPLEFPVGAKIHAGAPKLAVFSPDGEWVATVHARGLIRAWGVQKESRSAREILRVVEPLVHHQLEKGRLRPKAAGAGRQ